MPPPAVRKVLLLSALPPPAGGIATWTSNFLAAGLPRYILDLVDIRMTPERQLHVHRRLGLWELKRTVRILRSLRRKLRHERPDLVHLNCSLSARGIWRDLICLWLCRRAGVPVVTCYHGDVGGFVAESSRAAGWCLRRMTRQSRQNIALNRNSAEILRGIASSNPDNVHVIPNFIADEVLARPAHRQSAGDRLTVTYLGAISREKGCHDILQLAQHFPQLRFLLVGSAVPAMIPALQTAPRNVEVKSELPNSEVLSILEHSDIFLFPTYWREGFPVALLEAMSLGLPVVSTEMGAIPEMVEHLRGGYIVRHGDIAGLESALRNLMAAEQRAVMGSFNRAKAKACYSYSVVSQRWQCVYDRAIYRTHHGQNG
jgi:glycosyltransferase involved in cell wall biosynthesis